jgi:hypothetical protein
VASSCPFSVRFKAFGKEHVVRIIVDVRSEAEMRLGESKLQYRLEGELSTYYKR